MQTVLGEIASAIDKGVGQGEVGPALGQEDVPCPVNYLWAAGWKFMCKEEVPGVRTGTGRLLGFGGAWLFSCGIKEIATWKLILKPGRFTGTWPVLSELDSAVPTHLLSLSLSGHGDFIHNIPGFSCHMS